MKTAYLQRNPLCVMCLKQHVYSEATVVDHIVPASLGGAFWDEGNWQPLCRKHHNSDKQREDFLLRKRSGQGTRTASSKRKELEPL